MKAWRCILTLLTHYSQTAKINKIIMHVSLLPCFNSFFLFLLSRSCSWASSCVHQQFTATWLTTTFTLFEYWNGFCIEYWVDGLCWVLWRSRSIQYIGWCCRSNRKFFCRFVRVWYLIKNWFGHFSKAVVWFDLIKYHIW